MACMNVAALVFALIFAGCTSTTPAARSSSPPSGSPSTPATSSPIALPSPTNSPVLIPGTPLSWTLPRQIEHEPPFAGNLISAVSCPSVSLCVAVDDVGNVLTSRNPTGGAEAWTVTHVDSVKSPNTLAVDLAGVSCPTNGLCVAVDHSGNVITSTDPTGTSSAWTLVNVTNQG